jgi:hypothetical protein
MKKTNSESKLTIRVDGDPRINGPESQTRYSVSGNILSLVFGDDFTSTV